MADDSTRVPPVVHVTLIHGTFDPQAPWTFPESRMSRALSEALPAARISRFQWSGDNVLAMRVFATNQLIEQLKLLERADPGAVHVLIGHSHGGNIAAHAATRMGNESRVAGVIFLGTPFEILRLRGPNEFDEDLLRKALAALSLPFAVLIPAIFIRDLTALLWEIGLIVAVELGAVCFAALIFGGRAIAEHIIFQFWMESRIDPKLRLRAVRIAGDEASQVLGAGALISWISHRILAARFGRRAMVSAPQAGDVAAQVDAQAAQPNRGIGSRLWRLLPFNIPAGLWALSLFLSPLAVGRVISSDGLRNNGFSKTIPDRTAIPLLNFLISILMSRAFEVMPPGGSRDQKLMLFEQDMKAFMRDPRTMGHGLQYDERVIQYVASEAEDAAYWSIRSLDGPAARPLA